MKIVHISSVHPRYDVRIFIKECSSLVQAGHQVHLIIADGKGYEFRNGVHIHDVGSKSCRFLRMSKISNRVANKALSLKPDVVHFHDPELMLFAIKIKKHKVRVVYDVHEDVPRQILAKHWIPLFIRPFVSKIFEKLENYAIKYFDCVITSTPHIQQRFMAYHQCVISICNYPILSELLKETPWNERVDEVCYLGSISRIRGIEPIIKAIGLADVRLNLAGLWSDDNLKKQIMQQESWRYVNNLGLLDRPSVVKLLAKSKIGLVTLFPTANYLDSLPIKLFEYMASGIPVIASDFPVWRKIIEEAKCGILVNPEDPQAIAAAIRRLLDNPQLAQAMGLSAQEAVKKNYNWETQNQKLINLYAKF